MNYSVFKLALVIVIAWLHGNTLAQCGCLSGTKDKKKRLETVGGLTNSKDFYSLLIQKNISYADTLTPSQYVISVLAASRVAFSDSMLQTLGTFDLLLSDNTTLTIDSVRYSNDPLGFGPSLGFQVYLTEEEIKLLAANPIQTLTARGVLSTSFKEKKQAEQKDIFNCLLKRGRSDKF